MTILGDSSLAPPVSGSVLFLPSPQSQLPWWLRPKRICLQCRKPGVIPGWGRTLGEGHGNPLQYSCLENPMDRGAWWATVHAVTSARHLPESGPRSTSAAAAKSLQLCPTLCDPIDGSPPGSATPGILQARTLEWVAIPFSRRSS